MAFKASNKQIQHQHQEKMITNTNPSSNDMNIFKNEGEENKYTIQLASLLEKIAQKNGFHRHHNQNGSNIIDHPLIIRNNHPNFYQTTTNGPIIN